MAGAPLHKTLGTSATKQHSLIRAKFSKVNKNITQYANFVILHLQLQYSWGIENQHHLIGLYGLDRHYLTFPLSYH